MAYTNKKSAKRKHKKYRRRSKKGGVIIFKDHTKSNKSRQSSKREVNEADVNQDVATDYTRAALANAVAIFSRQEQEQALPQAQAQVPSIGVTVHGKSRAKREGPTPGQIKKAEQKALAKQLKEEEKAQKKEKKEQEKADKKAAKEEEKAAKEVTRAGVSQAFSSMFGEKY
jgi:hypothetical protein